MRKGCGNSGDFFSENHATQIPIKITDSSPGVYFKYKAKNKYLRWYSEILERGKLAEERKQIKFNSIYWVETWRQEVAYSTILREHLY